MLWLKFIMRWKLKFKIIEPWVERVVSRISVHDDQRSGRPAIVTDELVQKIGIVVRDDRRLTLDELSAIFPQSSRSLIHETITETLQYRKLSARWVLKQLTEQDKFSREQSSKEFLKEGVELFYSIHIFTSFKVHIGGDKFSTRWWRRKWRGGRKSWRETSLRQASKNWFRGLPLALRAVVTMSFHWKK